jgi:hypothetical protein
MAVTHSAQACSRWPIVVYSTEAMVPVRLEQVHAPRLGQPQCRLGGACGLHDRRDTWARDRSYAEASPGLTYV